LIKRANISLRVLDLLKVKSRVNLESAFLKKLSQRGGDRSFSSKGCEAFRFAEASPTNEAEQNLLPHLRESLFKKALAHLTRDLILQRSKSLQKFLRTLIFRK
jgi:hypothetical protein